MTRGIGSRDGTCTDEVEDVDALEVSTLHNGQVHRRDVVSSTTFRPRW